MSKHKPTTDLPADEQNGGQHPFSATELKAMSKDQLLCALHDQNKFIEGTIRSVVKEHALRAGQLLCELKRRVGHGKWTDWLKANFNGAPETARHYIRIHKEWPEIVKAGFEDWNLEELRKWLSSPDKETAKARKAKAAEAKVKRAAEQEARRTSLKTYNAATSSGDSHAECREYPPMVLFTDEANLFDELIPKLAVKFGVEGLSDVVFRAVMEIFDIYYPEGDKPDATDDTTVLLPTGQSGEQTEAPVSG